MPTGRSAMWRLATRNWWASPLRVAAIVLSVALGVAGLVVGTSGYETARRAITNQVVTRWLGAAHLTLFPAGAHWGALDSALAEPLSHLENLERITTRLTRRLTACAATPSDESAAPECWHVDARGVEAETEPFFRSWLDLDGRMLRPGESGAAVIERDLAVGLSVALGDWIRLGPRRSEDGLSLEVVGIFDGQRVADFQHAEVFLALAELQALTGEPERINAIDIRLRDASPQKLAEAEAAVRKIIADASVDQTVGVESTAARLSLLDEADRLMGLLFALVASISMLTSFFIILTTMSMSLFERRPRLGMLRCVGMTRAGLGSMLFLELAPLGLLGTIVGIAAGIPLSYLASELKGFVVEQTAFSAWGLALAAGSGLATTLVAGLLLFAEVARVTPMAAVTSESRAARKSILAACGVLGLALIAGHEAIVRQGVPDRWLEPIPMMAGAGSVFLGYVLLVPALVLLAGPPLARVVGAALRLPSALAPEICGRSPWRATGIGWMLMVGLSQIIYLSVQAESVRAIWNFPNRLPGAFVWASGYTPTESVDRIRALPWVRDLATTTDVDCEVTVERSGGDGGPPSLIERFWRKLTRPVFVAGDPHRLLDLVPVEFVSGNREDALRRLDAGGAVLIPSQTAHHLKVGTGDRLRVRIGSREASFEIAGVVQSPILDVAVTAFQATSYMQFAAASALLGTQRDLLEKFEFHRVSMVTFDIDLPQIEPPGEFSSAISTSAVLSLLPDSEDSAALAEAVLKWQPALPLETASLLAIRPALETWLAAQPNGDPLPESARVYLRRFAEATRYLLRHAEGLSPKERWDMFQERLALLRVADELGQPDAVIGSLRRLQEQVDRGVRLGMTAATWAPSVLLAVAILGVANLMMVSVRVRARQIALLRAVGASQSQVVRLVLGEALLLGLLGALAGVGLGIHLGYSDNRVTMQMIGFQPHFGVPLDTTLLAAGLTLAAGVAAAIVPALRAARENLARAMQIA